MPAYFSRKNIEKIYRNFRKVLDKMLFIWYNIYVIKRAQGAMKKGENTMYKIILTNNDDEIRTEIGGAYATIAQATEAMLGYVASKIREILDAHKSDEYLDDALEEIESETFLRVVETDENGEINWDGNDDGELLVYQDYDDYGTISFGKSNPYILYCLYTKDGIVRQTYRINTGKFEDNQ